MRAQTEKAVREWQHTCAAEIAATVLAGAWKPVIMHELREAGVLRFRELARRTGGLSERGLTRQLRELEEDGLVARQVYPQVPPKVEYRLTEVGEEAQEVLDVMARWGRGYAARFGPGEPS
ncbi:DNA-binding HxlR family transcriptional regulator [Naumannella cuiyingiana]|uniref:DNA-binding HxlR family transcriptional regulator n=1 Tax=Naumannella cuiyingiana TaxID=1347891 RepID=A0A7Z0ILL7_9ACTN|nr:DNA-binding HxlR family transcriptional regulator [Naumannella cuiyingiana]